MGIGAAQYDFLQRHAPLGHLCTLGAQDVGQGLKNTTIETLYRNLGVTQVDALDASDFQGATIVHDLNKPIAEEWHGQFDTVLDSGTLEHVFDVPTALRSMAAMLKPGGKLICINPANGWLHHGFYQFCPELVETFCRANGFRVLESSMYQRGTDKRMNARSWPDGKSLAAVCALKTNNKGDGNVMQERYLKRWA